MYPGSKVFISNGQSENHLTVFVNDETSPLTICDWKMFSYPRHEYNLGDTHWIIPNRFGLPWNILNEVGPAFLWAFIHLYPSVILFWGNHWKICSQWFGCREQDNSHLMKYLILIVKSHFVWFLIFQSAPHFTFLRRADVQELMENIYVLEKFRTQN